MTTPRDDMVRIGITIVMTAFVGLATSRFRSLEARNPKQAAAVDLRMRILFFLLMSSFVGLLVALALFGKQSHTKDQWSLLTVFVLFCAWLGYGCYRAFKRWQGQPPEP